MKKRLKHTHESDLWFFKKLQKKLNGNKFNMTTWKKKLPPGLNKVGFNTILCDIHLQFEQKFPQQVINKLTSEEINNYQFAFTNRINYLFSSQPNNSNGIIKRMRAMAYESGFMDAMDIHGLDLCNRAKSVKFSSKFMNTLSGFELSILYKAKAAGYIKF